MTLHTDELQTETPTEVIPVVPAEVDYRDDVDDDFLDEDFTQPRQLSRITVALVALLLVAIGFLGGVLVERTFGVSNAPAQRGGGAAVTGTARPPGGAGALGRL